MTARAHARRCGDCTACCTIMEISELDKPQGVACGQVCSRGCRIYERRPPSCRDFECLWKQGAFPGHWRPDKLHIVFNCSPDGTLVFGHVDPTKPDAWKAVESELTQLTKRGMKGALGINGKIFMVLAGEQGLRPQKPSRQIR